MDNQKLKTELNNIKDLEKYIGKEIGITDWFRITQDDINAFDFVVDRKAKLRKNDGIDEESRESFDF